MKGEMALAALASFILEIIIIIIGCILVLFQLFEWYVEQLL